MCAVVCASEGNAYARICLYVYQTTPLKSPRLWFHVFVQLMACLPHPSCQLTFQETGFFQLRSTRTHFLLPDHRLWTGGPALASSHSPSTKGLWAPPQEVGLLPKLHPATVPGQEKPPPGSFRFGTSRASPLTVLHADGGLHPGVWEARQACRVTLDWSCLLLGISPPSPGERPPQPCRARC